MPTTTRFGFAGVANEHSSTMSQVASRPTSVVSLLTSTAAAPEAGTRRRAAMDYS